MKSNFTLSTGDYSVHKFHSGEIQVTLNLDVEILDNCTITGSILSSDHIIELLQLVEALRHKGHYYLNLIMPYCAFSRQDRRCNTGDSFSLKVFTNLINSCKFDSVTTYDNHSNVATALIDNCVDIPTSESSYLANVDKFYDFYISPDAGANKKVLECSKKFQIPMIRADKSRDPLTMEITGTEVFATAEQLNGATVLIIDDILAGGRTMIELAKSLKEIQPNVTIHIFITHMFADYGFKLMIDAGISKFITTDSVVYSVHSKETIANTNVQVILL